MTGETKFLVGTGIVLFLLWKSKPKASAQTLPTGVYYGPENDPSLLTGGAVTMLNPSQLGQTSATDCVCNDGNGGIEVLCGCNEPGARAWSGKAPEGMGFEGGTGAYEPEPLGAVGAAWASGYSTEDIANGVY
jgi:hypothetical protein